MGSPGHATTGKAAEAPQTRQSRYRAVIEEALRLLGYVPGYESEQLLHFCSLVESASRFVDVGANRGLYSFIANELMTGGEIALVEADPDLAARLTARIEDWSKRKGNTIRVFGVAAGDRSERLPFFRADSDTEGTLTRKGASPGGGAVTIACEPLDNLFPPKPGTVLKVDVEGFEYRALAGARKLLGSDARVVAELHGWGDAERRKYPFHVLGLMRDLGFTVTRVGRSFSYEFTRAGRPQRYLAYLRWATLPGLKYVARRLGLRRPS